MKKTISALTLAIVLATVVYAQEDGGAPSPDSMRISALEKAVEQLIEENKKLRSEVNRLNRAVGDLAIERGESFYPKLFGNMTVDPKFREEVRKTNQGKLIVENAMIRTIVYFINGARWKIPKGTHTFWIPLGNAVVHTEREEPQTLTWKLSENKEYYESKVAIRPEYSVPRGI